ncbi:MAG: FecR domain-containing protein [Treponema sp.]|nr:FecR domain-containing protein [Treponema sp.]
MKNTLRFLVLFFVAALFSFPVFAEGASVTYIKGKVEVSRNGEWIPLKVGDSIEQSETVNTGFQSEARLRFNGSVMAIPALSRVTLETLATTDSKDSVSLYVDTGAVRSKVTHTENKKIDYTARTAVAVASVRGTDFTITAKGKVNCVEGAVAVYSAKKYKPAAPAEAEEKEEAEDEESEATEAVASETESETTVQETTTEVASESESPVQENKPAEVAVNTTEEAPAPADNSANQKNNMPATATTPAEDISAASPSGAVVVGAGQSTTFSVTGNPEKPASEVSQKTDKIKTKLDSQAEKESVSSGVQAVTKPEVVEVQKPTTGSIKVSIVLED